MGVAQFQTLNEFINSPFGTEKPMKEPKFDEELKHVFIEGFTTIESSYYIHIKIPSKSKQGVFYDVIIRFFPPTKTVGFELTLQNYNIQFFSNSPSFMYTYAVLYKNNGYLIEELYNKMDPNFFDKLPEKRNAEMKLSYDKSLYLACKFLSQHSFSSLSKIGVLLKKRKRSEQFFRDVSSFASIKLDTSIHDMEKNIIKKLDDNKSKQSNENKANEIPKHNNEHPKKQGITKKLPQKTTGKLPTASSVFTRKTAKSKKTARKTTRRN